VSPRAGCGQRGLTGARRGEYHFDFAADSLGGCLVVLSNGTRAPANYNVQWNNTMTNDYGSHKDYMDRVAIDADARQEAIQKALRDAFQKYIKTVPVEVIVFDDIDVFELASAIQKHPSVLKPLTAACNIAARAIERDLNINNLATYKPKLTREQATAIAGYIKPFLPKYLEVPALLHLDRVYFIDKQIRMGKGQWEKKITDSLNEGSKLKFKKRKFSVEGESFEIDAAYPITGAIQIAIDVKRIEARRDIHKRCDEIVNKAAKLKKCLPTAKFAAVIYYPFVAEQINISNRLRSENIDAVAFASDSEDSIASAANSLLAQLHAKRAP
jgi:hypothetical protein